MGGCQSLYYEDEDDKIIRERHKQQKKELYEFQKQLRLQRCFSEIDLKTGKGKSRKDKPDLPPPPIPIPTAEQVRIATNIIYDA